MATRTSIEGKGDGNNVLAVNSDGSINAKVRGILGPIDYIDFNTDYVVAMQEGRLKWNSDDGTLEVGMPGGNVNLQIGQEMLIRATNEDTVDINNGQVVYVSSASGANIKVKLANSSVEEACKTIAVSTEDVTQNQKGYFTTFGLVRDIDTTFGEEGDKIYLDSTDGGLTTTVPAHPNATVKIGYILRKHATEGIIFVNIHEDEYIKQSQSEQDPTGFDENQPNLRGDFTFNDSTRTLTIQPKAGQDYFNFWYHGTEFRKTIAETITISNDDGIHLVYYDSTGTLQELVNPTTTQVEAGIRTDVFVSIIYWNSVLGEAIYVGEERHLNQMDGSTHAYLHKYNGLQITGGLALTDISADGSGVTVDAQFGVEMGGATDEDIFELITAVTSTTGLPIYYQLGNIWYRDYNPGFSVRTFDNTDATRLAYNLNVGGTWQLDEATNNDFVLYHVFATTNKDEPMISIMGQNEYNTLGQARDGALTEVFSLITNDVLFPEIRPIATIIFQTNLGYANDVNAKIRKDDDGNDYVDWRSETINRVSITTSDHQALANRTVVGVHPASAVTYDNTSSGLTATTVQDAIDEVAPKITTEDINAVTGQKVYTMTETNDVEIVAVYLDGLLLNSSRVSWVDSTKTITLSASQMAFTGQIITVMYYAG